MWQSICEHGRSKHSGLLMQLRYYIPENRSARYLEFPASRQALSYADGVARASSVMLFCWTGQALFETRIIWTSFHS